GAMSPRTTAPYQTLDSGPSWTSPMTRAPGAMKAESWIMAAGSWQLRREAPLGPPRHRGPVPGGRLPRDAHGERAGGLLERRVVGGVPRADLGGAPVGADAHVEHAGPRRALHPGRDRDERV